MQSLFKQLKIEKVYELLFPEKKKGLAEIKWSTIINRRSNAPRGSKYASGRTSVWCIR